MASSQDSDSQRRFHCSLSCSDSSLPSPRPWASSFASTAAIRVFPDEDSLTSLAEIKAASQAHQSRVKRLHLQFREQAKALKKTAFQAREKRKIQQALIRRLNRSLDRLVEDTAETSKLVEKRAIQRKWERGTGQTMDRQESRCSSCRLF